MFNNKVRIAQLDGWRGICISTVVIGHLIDQRYGNGLNEAVLDISRVLSIWAVDVFFVISGFIITKLAIREHVSGGGFSIRDFYVRRFFRIVPPFLVFVAFVVFAMMGSLILKQYSAVIAAVAFTCSLEYVNCSGFVGHTWSLAYEEQFYIAFAPLFALLAVYARPMFVAIFLTLLSLPFLRFALGSEEFLRTAARLAPSFSFIGGGAIAAVYEGEMVKLSKRGIGNFCSAGAAILVVLILLSDVLLAIPGNSLPGHVRASLNFIVLPACFSWLVGSSLYQSNAFTRMLVTRPLLFVGMISYSLYLWQQLFTAPLELYSAKSVLLLPPLMLVAALLSYYSIERPSARLGKRILARVRGQALGPVASL